jgi:hypothetical protein
VHLQPFLDGPGRQTQAILLCRPHLDQLASAGDQRRQRLRLFIGHRADRRLSRFGKVREDLRVEPIGLGELPGRSGKLTDLPRSDDHNRQSGGDKRSRQRHFETARRFEHDQDGLEGMSPLHRVGDPTRVIGNLERGPGVDHYINTGLRDIHAHKDLSTHGKRGGAASVRGLRGWWAVTAR